MTRGEILLTVLSVGWIISGIISAKIVSRKIPLIKESSFIKRIGGGPLTFLIAWLLLKLHKRYPDFKLR